MAHKYVVVPAPIALRTGNLRASDGLEILRPPLAFRDWIADQVLAGCGTKLSDLERNLRILASVRAADSRKSVSAPYGVIELESEHWQLMVRQLEERDWNMFFLMQLAPFVEALSKAGDSAPAEAAEPVED